MAKQPVNNRATQAFDKEVGNRLRSYRNSADLSQQELGDKLGVTFQQVQKYERGSNRLSFGRAVAVAKLFEVDLRELAGVNGMKVTRALDGAAFKMTKEFNELDDEMKPDALTILRLFSKHVRPSRKQR